MRVLVCGSRSWLDREPIRRELKRFRSIEGVQPNEVVVIHGAARGVDSIAGEIAVELGFDVVACPAEWNRFGKAAGPIRNEQMLREHCPELVLAFARDLSHSTGTAHMVRIAQKAGVKVQLFHS